MIVAKFLVAIALLAIAAAVGVLLGMLEQKLMEDNDES